MNDGPSKFGAFPGADEEDVELRLAALQAAQHGSVQGSGVAAAPFTGIQTRSKRVRTKAIRLADVIDRAARKEDLLRG